MTSLRVLVVGGAGYIGSHVCKLLAAAGHSVVVFDNLERGNADAVKWGRLIQGDLRNLQEINNVFSADTYDAVMHFAAYAYVGESVSEPDLYFQNNVVGTLNLLAAMSRHSVSKLVFSSTCAVYGTPSSVPVTEESPLAPESPYGASKLMAEQAIDSYARLGRISPVIFRYFNVIGSDPDGEIGEDHEPETHILPIAVEAAMGERSHFSIYGDDYPTRDGTCIRDYVHVNDLARAHILALNHTPELGRHVFNLGTGVPLSVKQILDKVDEVSGAKIQRQVNPRREGDAVSLYATAKKANSVLNWKPKHTDISFAVENVISYVKKKASRATPRH